MRTLIISDLHLGSISRSDVLRSAELRGPLLQAASQVDRLVLLGDVLELRHGPPREALAAARGFFEDLGSALAGSELVVIAGNHDHALIAPWLARRAEQPVFEPLALQQLIEVPETSSILKRLASWASPARVSSAYPGIWLREDVYATHGHYLDCHLTVPTLERLSAGAMARLLGRPAGSLASVDDYEAITAPMYAWRHAVALAARTGRGVSGFATIDAWRALGGASDRSRGGEGVRARRRRRSLAASLRVRALVAAFPLAIAVLNRAGVGPLRANISAGELRAAGLRAMSEVAERLKLTDSYVIFGHTHRAGPLPDDDLGEWNPPVPARGGHSGARLINTGCWTYDPVFLSPDRGASPYWPGSAVLVEDSGPPQLQRLLLESSHEELRASRG